MYVLDTRSKLILKFLVKECKEGSYKILDISELLSSLPKKFIADKEIINQSIKHLENGGYISIKYEDENEFCLCPLPFGRQFIENEEIQKIHNKSMKKFSLKREFILLVIALIGSFLGSFLFQMVVFMGLL